MAVWSAPHEEAAAAAAAVPSGPFVSCTPHVPTPFFDQSKHGFVISEKNLKGKRTRYCHIIVNQLRRNFISFCRKSVLSFFDDTVNPKATASDDLRAAISRLLFFLLLLFPFFSLSLSLSLYLSLSLALSLFLSLPIPSF
jgi:hypothetical protein